MNKHSRIAVGASLIAAFVSLAPPAFANDAAPPSDRLLIVDGNTDEVIYDDGVDDLFCVTRTHSWRDDSGRVHRRRKMHCR